MNDRTPSPRTIVGHEHATTAVRRTNFCSTNLLSGWVGLNRLLVLSVAILCSELVGGRGCAAADQSATAIAADSATVDLSPTASSTPTVTRPVQWLMFTTSGCGPCIAARRDFADWLSRSGWQVDDHPQAHVRLVDATREPDLTRDCEITSFPTFLLVADGEVVERWTSYRGRELLARRYNETIAARRVPGAFTVSHWPGGRPLIRDALSTTRSLLGDVGQLDVRWDRGQSSELQISNTTAIELPATVTFRYVLEGDTLRLRFAEPQPVARWRFLRQPVQGVAATIDEVTLELAGAPDVRWTVTE